MPKRLTLIGPMTFYLMAKSVSTVVTLCGIVSSIVSIFQKCGSQESYEIFKYGNIALIVGYLFLFDAVSAVYHFVNWVQKKEEDMPANRRTPISAPHAFKCLILFGIWVYIQEIYFHNPNNDIGISFMFQTSMRSFIAIGYILIVWVSLGSLLHAIFRNVPTDQQQH